MRRILLFFATLMFAVSVFAQDLVPRHLIPINKVDYSYAKQLLKKEPINFNTKEYLTIDVPGTPIGLTGYDLQSNSAVAHRIYVHPDGTVSAVWLEDQENPDGGSTRGTGYNFFDGSDWLYTTMDGTNVHIEGSQRTGWPAYMVSGSNELVTNHYRSAGGLFLWTSAIGANGSGWTQGAIEGGFPEAMLWPRAVSTHGSDGNDHLYVIAVDDLNNSPSEITGLYLAQSHDGGNTWTAALLPGFTEHYYNGNGDIYAIDARDSVVAIAYFADYGDLMVWKSTDYGATWDTLKVNDFPVDRYNFFTGTTVDMDNNGTADTVLSTDNTGDIIITPDNKVHVTFGVMRYLDEDASDNGSFSYFPYTDGILYWNEDMGSGEYTGLDHDNFVGLNVPAQTQLIAYSFDLNGNGIIWEGSDSQTPYNFGKYYTSITTMPSMATDDSGNIYVAFTTVMEGPDFIKANANPEAQSFRHAWIRVKPADTTGLDVDEDGWLPPYCVSTIDGISAENVFINLPRRLTDTIIHMWTQFDDEPGLHIRGDSDPATQNYIVYKAFPVSMLGVKTATSVENIEKLNVKVYPNPVSDYMTVSNVKDADISIYNILGKQIMSFHSPAKEAVVDMSQMPSGAYIITVEKDGVLTHQKVVKN